MKKALSVTMTAAIAASALTPAAAFAAETPVAQNGFYNIQTGQFYSTAAFKALTKAEQKSVIKDANFYIVSKGTVYSAMDLVTKTTEQLATAGQTQDAFQAAKNVTLTPAGTVLDKDGNVIGEKPSTGELAVESVSAINAKELQVKFNTPVEKSSVIDSSGDLEAGVVSVSRTSTDAHASDVTAGDLVGYAASLSEDGKTLTVIADSGEFFKGNYDVKVAKAVKKNTLEELENFYSKFTAKDTAAPTVTSVKYDVADDNFVVTLSEPIDALTGEVLRVNGQPVAGFDVLSGSTNELTFDRPADVEPGTTASIYVAGLKDAAGNLMNSYTGNVTVTKDAAALAISEVKQILNDTARVTFNKKLDAASKALLTTTPGSDGLTIIKPNGDTTTNYTVTVVQDASGADVDNQYDIKFNDATFANSDTEKFSVTFQDEAFKGVSGTENKVITKDVTLNKDTVAPTATSTKLSLDGKTIEVTMSESVDISTVDDQMVKLRRNGAELQSGVAGSETVKATLKAGTDNVLVITTTTASALNADGTLKAGTYQVRLEAGAIEDLNGNANKTVNAPNVVVEGDSTVAPASAAIANGSGDNTFTITAPGSETFTTASLNYSNFVLDGQTIPADSDITLNPARTVITVKLPVKNSVNIAGPALFKAGGLTYVSGNPYATSTDTVTVADNTPATLTASKVLGNTLELTFNEAVDPATLSDIDEVLTDFTIKSDAGTFAKASVASPGPGTPASATVAQGSTDKKIVITVVPEDSNWSTVVAGSNLTVTTKQAGTTGEVTNLEDVNGVKVKAPVKVTVAK